MAAISLALAAVPAIAQSGLDDGDMRAGLQRAAAVVPHPRQLAWQRLEFIGFIHFGPNTFTDRAWGTGRESPGVFQPAELDARQWARVFKGAGMKQVILTAKHHDGFCLWPSRFTEHSVKNSPWRGGRGDVVSELSEACRQAGLKLGIYLSPADLNAIERGVYGKTPAQRRVIPAPVPGWTPRSGLTMEGTWDEYNAYFLNQLFELLTEYGDIGEVWIDGANPKPGTGQTYAYADWYALIRRLQPDAVIFGKGPDVRWCGNEDGRGRESEWSVIPLPVPPERFDWPDMTAADLGSRTRIRNAPYLHWYPAEVDVSIRPEWFWHPSEDGKLKRTKSASASSKRGALPPWPASAFSTSRRSRMRSGLPPRTGRPARSPIAGAPCFSATASPTAAGPSPISRRSSAHAFRTAASVSSISACRARPSPGSPRRATPADSLRAPISRNGLPGL
jgi:alpha-L-fucosidase